jgi:hypothetical protein
MEKPMDRRPPCQSCGEGCHSTVSAHVHESCYAKLRRQLNDALDIIQKLYGQNSLELIFEVHTQEGAVRKLFAEARPEVLPPTKEPSMTPEEIDEAVAEIVDEMLELREKAQSEPWTDIDAYVDDIKRRLLAKMEKTDG